MPLWLKFAKKGNKYNEEILIVLATARLPLHRLPSRATVRGTFEFDGGPMIVEDIEFDLHSAPNSVIANHHKGYDFGGLVGCNCEVVRLEAERQPS
ncbi:MAG: hypothetical protein H0W34_14020 [Pyrinomonadaceae bacterium]|nr:hypothetical protein [Pyrinomonadaceae bacterium]